MNNELYNMALRLLQVALDTSQYYGDFDSEVIEDYVCDAAELYDKQHDYATNFASETEPVIQELCKHFNVHYATGE